MINKVLTPGKLGVLLFAKITGALMKGGIVTVLSMILIGPPLFIYSVIKHHKRRG